MGRPVKFPWFAGLLWVCGCASLDRPQLDTAAESELLERVLPIAAGLESEPGHFAKPHEETSQHPIEHGFAIVDPPERMSLRQVLDYARKHNPRLEAARALVEKAAGQEQIAFAPFLPQLDIQSQTGVTSPNLGPGIPGIAGFMIPEGDGSHSYAQIEAQLQWTLYDFGRTGSRHRQAAAREGIARFRLARAEQTVDFDATVAFMNALLARASRVVAEDAIRRSESALHDAKTRRRAGTADLDVELRAQVQLSEIRELLVDALQTERDALARLNHAMGRNASLPVEVADMQTPDQEPPRLTQALEKAVELRPEIGLTRQMIAAAVAGREAAQAEFQPKIYARATAGHAGGNNIRTGWQEGAGLHLDMPLYAGGKLRGELRMATAEVTAAMADARTVLDGIGLEVNLAHRSTLSARERIALTRTAVDQAREHLRLTRVKFVNGNATPTDIVDAETTLTRTEQRHARAGYAYMAALARLAYASGDSPCDALKIGEDGKAEPEGVLPPPSPGAPLPP